MSEILLVEGVYALGLFAGALCTLLWQRSRPRPYVVDEDEDQEVTWHDFWAVATGGRGNTTARWVYEEDLRAEWPRTWLGRDGAFYHETASGDRYVSRPRKRVA